MLILFCLLAHVCACQLPLIVFLVIAALSWALPSDLWVL